MVDIRRVEADEVALARDLHNRFTGQEKSLATVRSWYEDVPGLFLFAVADGEVIGVCTGRPWNDREVSLAGIGVEPDRRGAGVGTRLLERFEESARELGIEQLSVASAGGRVDDFYIDNGFCAEKILVTNPEKDPVEVDDTDFDIDWDRNEDGSRKCYVDVEEHDPAVLQAVREEFVDERAIYVMVKELPASRND